MYVCVCKCYSKKCLSYHVLQWHRYHWAKFLCSLPEVTYDDVAQIVNQHFHVELSKLRKGYKFLHLPCLHVNVASMLDRFTLLILIWLDGCHRLPVPRHFSVWCDNLFLSYCSVRFSHMGELLSKWEGQNNISPVNHSATSQL